MKNLKFEKFEGSVALVTIDCKDSRVNKVSSGLLAEISSLLDEMERDPDIKALVIASGKDDNFVVGADVDELNAMKTKEEVVTYITKAHEVLRRIERLRFPVVCAISGNCLGGGLELPLACHFRLAALDGARIGLPELHLGTVPAWGGSARLARRVGRDRAIDLILRAKTVSGPEALDIGLVTEVWPNTELKQRAVALAEELAAMPRLAVAAMLRCLVSSDEKTLAESLRDERAAVHATLASPDAREGMAAFLEKRKPVFG